MINRSDLERITDDVWEIPKREQWGMRVPARIYASEKLIGQVLSDRSVTQLINVTNLPGIRRYALAMPDAHEGYGFPIGGVAAFDPDEGVISPGGIGYDINCGVRMLRSSQTLDDLRDRIPALAKQMAREVPSGVGRGGSLNVSGHEMDAVLRDGAKRLVELGHGVADDLRHIESGGTLPGADPALVSKQAKERGRDQLGTMGSGNHFVEIDVVDRIFDEEAAERLDLREGQLVVLIHTGSRGLGHQVATDFLRVMMKAMARHRITIPDRELACAPFHSSEGQEYFAAMAAAANFAFANRQLITAEVRRAWASQLGQREGKLDIVYDVAHNVAKVEEHEVAPGVKKKLVVHRKGATRAFPGQTVLIPGSMGTASWLLLGQEAAMEQSFGSTCHGAGRTMSRSRAKKEINAQELKHRLRAAGIHFEAGSASGLVEEAPEAYKDVDEVIDVVHRAGIATKIARVRPVAVVKG